MGTAVTNKRMLKFAEFGLTKYAARRDAKAAAECGFVLGEDRDTAEVF